MAAASVLIVATRCPRLKLSVLRYTWRRPRPIASGPRSNFSVQRSTARVLRSI